MQEFCLRFDLLQFAFRSECVPEVSDELLSLFAVVDLDRGWNAEFAESLDRLVVERDLVVFFNGFSLLLSFLILGVGWSFDSVVDALSDLDLSSFDLLTKLLLRLGWLRRFTDARGLRALLLLVLNAEVDELLTCLDLVLVWVHVEA